jgi:serine/threonine protein kinase
MESASLGFEFETLRDYWRKEVRSPETASQHLLLVHPKVVQDLAGIVGRLSFPAQSAENLKTWPDAPPPYRLVAPLGTSGAWKEVYAAANTEPGSWPENIVALKRYKTAEGEQTAVERDVKAINLLLSGRHEHLSTPGVLRIEGGDTWILEPLWTASLEDLIKRQGPRRDILELFEIAEHLFSGLAKLHEFNLRHTDIKPDNCGVVIRASGGRTYVLGDFGCVSSMPDKMPADRRLLGTLRTRAPEIIAHGRISLASDVWSMAATIYSLCRMEYPFVPFDAPHHDSGDRHERERRIESDISSLVDRHKKNLDLLLPPILGNLLRPCFKAEGEDRPPAGEVYQLFHKERARLTERGERLFSTAWQRAEDILQRFTAQERWSAQRGLDAEQKDELKELMTTYRDFVPAQLITDLEGMG